MFTIHSTFAVTIHQTPSKQRGSIRTSIPFSLYQVALTYIARQPDDLKSQTHVDDVDQPFRELPDLAVLAMTMLFHLQFSRNPSMAKNEVLTAYSYSVVKQARVALNSYYPGSQNRRIE